MNMDKQKPIKNIILDILEKEWPLTAKQIYYTIKKISSRRLTYQAVFKAVKELTKNGVLVCDKKSYKLNIKWLYAHKESTEKRIKSYLLKELKLKEDFEIPTELHTEVLRFVHYVGPKTEKYIGKNKGCIVVVSGGAHVFGTALLHYLIQKNKKVNRVVIDRFSKDIIKHAVENRKLIVVDSGTHTGRTYIAVMDMLKSVRKKYNIKDIKYAAYFDRAGIADWSCPMAYDAVEYMI